MTDTELVAELRALEALEDKASTSDPSSLLRRIMPGYVRRPHLNVIAHEMTRVERGEIDRLLITVPPQTGKTVTAVVGGSLWWLARHPSARVIIGSYGDSLAVDRGRESRRLVQDHGSRFGLQLERGSEAVQDWRLVTGGGVLSVGIGAGVTGKPGDIAFIDDPHKSREEAESLRMRDRADRWLSADIISRLSPGAPLIMILTRWHQDDLAARVTAHEGTTDKGGRWHVIRMPALCDDPERDPLGRAYGAPLPHPKIKLNDEAAALKHWEDKRSSTGVRDWYSLYMCDPRPAEGALLTYQLLRERRHFSDPAPAKRTGIAVDPSGGGRDTAGIIAGHLGTDGRLYLSHDRSGVMPSDRWARVVCELAVEIDADVIIFESNFGGDQSRSLIGTAWDALSAESRESARRELVETNPTMSARDVERALDRMRLPYSGPKPRIKDVRARKNKLLRAEPAAQKWIEDQVRTAAYLPDLEAEWATWQPTERDSPGRIDASVYLIVELLPASRPGSGGSTDQIRGSLPTTGISPLDIGGSSGWFGPLG